MTQYNSTYRTPITLGFTPTDGDIIRGTVNGVEVSGEWMDGRVELRNDYDESIYEVKFFGENAAFCVDKDSAPTTDYELHLYRYDPASIVKIPREYVEGMEMLPKDAVYYWTQPTSKRAFPVEKVAQRGEAHHLCGKTIRDVDAAYRQALSEASPDDFIFIGGSSYVVADLLSREQP